MKDETTICSEKVKAAYLWQLLDNAKRRVNDLPRGQYNKVDDQQQIHNDDQLVVTYHLMITIVTTTATRPN